MSEAKRIFLEAVKSIKQEDIPDLILSTADDPAEARREYQQIADVIDTITSALNGKDIPTPAIIMGLSSVLVQAGQHCESCAAGTRRILRDIDRILA